MNQNDIDTLKFSIDSKQYNLLKLLSIIYDNQYKNNSILKKINNILSKNEIDKLDNIFNSTNTIRILLYCNWCTSEELCNLWNKMSKGNYTWDNIEIVSEEPCDYYCIINKPPDNISLDLSKTILFRMEPHMDKHPAKWGENWANPDKDKFLFYGSHDLHRNNTEWHISKTYTQLMNEEIIKNETICNILSTVLSDKYSDPGHMKRIDFIKFIENKGVNVHVYGGNRFNWKLYKGTLPYHEKDNALLPYKYTFNCENYSIKNYCTEKLFDGILSECLVFYNGCYNAKDFINEKAFVYLELSNFEKDYQTIKTAIEENWWEERLPFIKEAKQKILNEMQFFPRIKKIIEKN